MESLDWPSDNYHPKSAQEAFEVLAILKRRLPTELALTILEDAEYWVLSRVTKKGYLGGRHVNDEPWLISDPIHAHAEFPLREIRIDVRACPRERVSGDGDGPHGFYTTYFNVGIERGPAWEEQGPTPLLTMSTRFVRLLPPGWQTHHELMRYRASYASELWNCVWVGQARNGDRVALRAIELSPGVPDWLDHEEDVSLELYYSPF